MSLPDEPDASTPPDRETLDRLTESLADLLRRMAEFQEEMKPFLPLLSEPLPEDAPPAAPSPEDPQGSKS